MPDVRAAPPDVRRARVRTTTCSTRCSICHSSRTAVTQDFPRAIKALHQSTPIFEFARPYIPDLVAWVVNWDGIFAPYDANGHYARTVPVLDAFNFADDSAGRHAEPDAAEPPRLRRRAQTGFLQRCPGAAIVPPPDHSAPFFDSGPLSNPHCTAV